MKDIYNIIKEFEKFPYAFYLRKRSKNEPTESKCYLARHLSKCMMRHNLHVGSVRTQMTNTQKINNSEINTQKIFSLHTYYLDNNKSKGSMW